MYCTMERAAWLFLKLLSHLYTARDGIFTWLSSIFFSTFCTWLLPIHCSTLNLISNKKPLSAHSLLHLAFLETGMIDTYTQTPFKVVLDA